MKELKKQIKEGRLHSCYLFYGEESYLIEHYTQKLKRALLSEDEELMNMDTFLEKKADVSSIIAAAETMPFLAAHRFVLVKDSGLLQAGRKNDSDSLAEYVSNIPQSACLLFVEESVDKRGKLYKAVAKAGYVVEMKPLNDKDLSRFLIGESKKSGVFLGSGEADYFCYTVGGGMNHMLLELGKLTAYKGPGECVAKEDIDAVCTKSLELRVFDLVDAMAVKNAQLALEIYRNLIQRKESPIMVLAMLYRQFRMIYQCKILAETGISQREIAAKTGLRDFMVRGSLKQGGRFSIVALKTALLECLQTDVEIKSGKINGELAVELILLKYSR